ncbi:hypothetical protein GH810_12025 [Acetobacterium paludosum]|uniref:DUF2178 domain-containing protein n=1 Tax=Acetobacterium paludosum TaxID=52693 RepID=A0A923KT54_9FIRM|nr:hypothetical protein [Acetobacterium paludosum]MBC3889042.1 hypothetical protein [Acetobacterium paludosum]
MEEFRTKVKRRIILASGLTLVAVALGIYAVFSLQNVPDDATMSAGFISGFQFGLIMSIGILSMVTVVKLRRALNDEIKLKVLYNKEHDERLKTIRSKAGQPLLSITSVLMIIAAIIAGYFNIVVFYTLVAAVLAQLAISAGVKLVCMTKM